MKSIGRNSKNRSRSREGSSSQHREFNLSRTNYQGLNCTYCGKSGHTVEECRKRLREQDSENAPGSSGKQTMKGRRCESEAAKAPVIRSEDSFVTLIRLADQPWYPMKMKLSSDDLKRDVMMLIVTGMADNLLKIGALKSNVNIDATDILNLKSICGGESFAHSLGSVKIEILNKPICFHIIDDDFNIPGDGIVSSDFCHEKKVTLSRHVMKINGLPFAVIKSPDDSIPLDVLNEHQSTPDPRKGHSIHLMGNPDNLINPVFPRPRFSPKEESEIDRQVAELLERDIIVPSDSPYDFPVLLVPAKDEYSILRNNGKMLVVDYRLLNEKTVADAYPLPKTIDILENIGSAKYFSILVLAGSSYQIPMNESSASKTAFSTRRGHFQFKRMPPGLKNGPATFQRRMDEAFVGMLGKGVFAYFSNIVVYTDSFDSHLGKLRKVFERLKSASLSLDLRKCEYAKSRVIYLGHLISEHGIGMDPEKIEGVKNFARPKSVKDIQQFLGLAGSYSRFIKDYSEIARPLTNLLKKDVKFQWSYEQERAFLELRETLCDKPMLHYPNFTKPFVLTTETFEYTLGGALSQIGENGGNMPISFASRLLNTAEENYSEIEKKILAVVYAVEHYRSHLFGKKFTLVTDRQSLDWLNSIKNPPLRIANWKAKLAEFEYRIVNK